MLLWNGLLVLFVLLAEFPWNTARPQLHLLSLTVKKLRCQASHFTLRSQNLQYKTHPEFWPSHRRIFKTSLYYKMRLILETRRYITLSLTHWLVGGHNIGFYTGLNIKHLAYMAIGHVVLKMYVPYNNFRVPAANICTSPVNFMYTAGQIRTCSDWKITCPVGHVTTEVYIPWTVGQD